MTVPGKRFNLLFLILKLIRQRDLGVWLGLALHSRETKKSSLPKSQTILAQRAACFVSLQTLHQGTTGQRDTCN